MAKVKTRIELIEYCLRRLGFPVIEINIDDDQIQDRIDDALDYYKDYHFDGTERAYLAVEVTQADIDDGSVAVPADMIFISRALPFGRSSSSFYPMNDKNASWDFNSAFGRGAGGALGGGSYKDSSTSAQGNAGKTNDLTLTTYWLNMQYYEQANAMFGAGEVPIRFNRHTGRVYLDTDLDVAGLEVGAFVMLEGYRVVDPETHYGVYDDRWVKRYATAQIKKQWGANLIKYSGIALPGGVTLDGDKLFNDANEEIDKLEEEMQSMYEEPPMPMMG